MKLLYETADYSEALVIKALIQQAGFLVHLDNFNTLTAMPHLTAGLGLRVMVPDDDFDEAQKLLAEARAENTLGMATEDSIDACPKCGAEDVMRYTSLVWLPFLWLMGLLYPVPPGNKRACRACGHRYKTKGPAITGPLKLILLVLFLVFVTIFAFDMYYSWQEGPRYIDDCHVNTFC